MKNTNTTKRLAALEIMIAAIADNLNIGTSSVPKTSARETGSNDKPAPFAKRSKSQIEPVAITLTQAMIDGRMKLPARMFTKGTKVVVDGNTFTQQPQDQNRSTKFSPEIFGDVAVGDILVFSHEGGREWTVEIEAGSRKGRKSAKPVAKQAKTTKAAPKAKSAKPSRTRDADEGPRLPHNATASEMFDFFSDRVIEGYENGVENENIKQTGSFANDPRIYLTTAQNQQLRSARKRLGLSLDDTVAGLRKACNM